MGIRMSGLSSGLDTEAIVGALMSAQSLKKTRLIQAKTKLEWTQTKWKDLNTKLYKLYSEQVSKLRLQTSYMTKKATASDETKAKITASAKAVNGSYTMEINNIATAQYLTGSKINADKGTAKMVDLDSALLNKEVEVKVGDKTTKFTITEDMTIDDFTSELKNAGLNANFDAAQKRLFISSKDSGLANAFSITTSGVSNTEVTARKNLRDAVDYDSMTAENKKIVDDAMKKLETSGVDTTEYQEALDAITGAALSTRTAKTEAAASTYVKAKLYGENYAAYEEKAKKSLKSNYFTEDGEVKDELKTKYAEEFNIYTQEEKEKLGVENMTEEEYLGEMPSEEEVLGFPTEAEIISEEGQYAKILMEYIYENDIEMYTMLMGLNKMKGFVHQRVEEFLTEMFKLEDLYTNEHKTENMPFPKYLSLCYQASSYAREKAMPILLQIPASIAGI